MYPEIATSPAMDNRPKYEYINLRPADNGWVLSYDCWKAAKTNHESYYDNKTEVFTLEQTEKAFRKLQRLHVENLMHDMEREKDETRKAAMMGALSSIMTNSEDKDDY